MNYPEVSVDNLKEEADNFTECPDFHKNRFFHL